MTEQPRETTPLVDVEPPSSSSPSTVANAPTMDPRAHLLNTTPGVDDTPYIRFAIDQLTRDEEVRGSRRYRNAAPPNDRSEGQTERAVADEEPAYTEEEELLERHDPRQVATASQLDRPVTETTVSEPREFQTGAESPVEREVFIPFLHPTSYQHPPLDFLPGILRPFWLGLYMFLVLILIVIFVIAAVWDLSHEGIWAYGTFGDSRYFVFEYLPQILGMIVLIWLFQIEAAVLRVMPFKCLASDSVRSRGEAYFLDLYPIHYLIPNLQYFRAGQSLLGLAFITFWLFVFSIPLLSGIFNVHYFSEIGWQWVASQGIIWATIGLYVLMLLGVVMVASTLWMGPSGLKWDPKSLADIIVLISRSNNLAPWTGSETFTSTNQFVHRLANRADRLGYWNTSKRTKEVFYCIGEEGASTRRFSVEAGRIREKAPEMAFPDTEDLEAGDVGSSLYNNHTRNRYLPWFLKTFFVFAWIAIAAAVLVAFLVVSFVDSATIDGFAPAVETQVSSIGFSASNTLFSLVPSFLGLLAFLGWATIDQAIRRLAPYSALARANGATAEDSLLVDYSARLPFAATLAALTNGHYLPALTSFFTLTSATIPVLAGGVFWTQYYPNTKLEVRVAAEPGGFYALCFFLALHALGYVFLLAPDRARAALPLDASRNLAQTIAVLYQSPLLADRTFHSPVTRAELVARLLGPSFLLGDPATERERDSPRLRNWRSWASLTGAGPSTTTQAERREGLLSQQEREAIRRQGIRASAVVEDGVRFGFGVFVGRDGKEHLGIERVERQGRKLYGY
jgi:hypothetical protein